MLTLYGIPNCDQVKKARHWLTAQGHVFDFVDFKKTEISPDLMSSFLRHTDWTTLLNRKGTTWRKLSPQDQAAVHDTASAMSCMIAHPSMIKRPLLLIKRGIETELIVGFSETQYQRLRD